jgi:hypothetical protein
MVFTISFQFVQGSGILEGTFSYLSSLLSKSYNAASRYFVDQVTNSRPALLQQSYMPFPFLFWLQVSNSGDFYNTSVLIGGKPITKTKQTKLTLLLRVYLPSGIGQPGDRSPLLLCPIGGLTSSEAQQSGARMERRTQKRNLVQVERI